MAKSLALINKDIAQHYKLQNLIAPPEAAELTKVYDELKSILDKPHSPIKEPELDKYYKLLFKFIKLLHVIKFGVDNEQITKQNLESKDEEKEEDTTAHKESFFDVTNKSSTFEKSQNSETTNDDYDEEEEEEDEDDEEEEEEEEKETTPKRKPKKRTKSPNKEEEPAAKKPSSSSTPKPRAFQPTPEKLDKYFEDVLKRNEPTTPIVLDLVSLLYKHVKDLKIVPGLFGPESHDIFLHGRIYNIKTVAKILKNLQEPNNFNAKNLDDDYKKLFDHVIRPIIEKHASPHLTNELHGFKQYQLEESPRRRIRKDDLNVTALANPSHSQTSPNKLQFKGGKGKPLGKIHWKRWQSHIK